jgi:Zn-finger nucleic acid-binding protein
MPWSEVSYGTHPDEQGVVRSTIGAFPHGTYDLGEVITVTETQDTLEIAHESAEIHSCARCGGEWVGGGTIFPLHKSNREVEKPVKASQMRALPDGWTRIDRGLAPKAGQVSEYVLDDTWEAFVDIYETAHDGNGYDPDQGRYCAVLLTGSPERGLWERDTLYADDRTDCAKPLMRRFNRGEYES